MAKEDIELFSAEEMQSPFDAIKEVDGEGRDMRSSAESKTRRCCRISTSLSKDCRKRGSQLKVRGYIGMFYETQTWKRKK